MEALGYRANTAARILAGGRSRTLGVIAVETQQFGPSHMLFGIEAAARTADLALTFVTLRRSTRDDLRSTLDHLRNMRVEGVIVIAPVRQVVDAVRGLDVDLPLVLVGGDPSTKASTVTIDQHAGARLATEHLLALGHAAVHHISGPRTWIDASERVRGWEDALRAHGTGGGRLYEGDWSARGGYVVGTRLSPGPGRDRHLRGQRPDGPGGAPGARRARKVGSRPCERGGIRRHPGGRFLPAALDDHPAELRRCG